MKSRSIVWSMMPGLLMAGSVVQAQDALVAKQLAGPASEFASMRPANPADAAIHSKSALIAVEMAADKSGVLRWQGAVPVETSDARFLLFSGDASDWQVSMRAPGAGSAKAASLLARDQRIADFGVEAESHTAEYFAFQGMSVGQWNLDIEAGSDTARRGFLLLEGDSSTQLMSYQTSFNQLQGQQIGFIASLYADQNGEAMVGKSAGAVHLASLRVTAPDGSVFNLRMHDDGLNADGAAGDGVYGASFKAEQVGTYQAQVMIRGQHADGRPLLRTAEHVLPVVRPSIRLAADKASGVRVDADGERLAIRIPVAAEKADQHYRAYAEVWGRDAKGHALAVAWVGGMVTPDKGALSLALDSRWLALAGAQAPFELRNLRLEDPDYFISVAAAEQLPLAMPKLTLRRADEIQIDESMLMGTRPAALNVEKNTGRRLVLVHGYCSGGVWPQSQFATSSTFLDANQNRTHDQFARLIQTYGNNWNSFGVVAHSQGGAASLHLYTYYWSGLDRATGSRLIQSVGTPYQGTNLAGILATLGNWFGVGCGNNANLNYSGASSWLAGIPTWARSKVNYYTTAFRSTNWWTNDYCNFATDLVLSDPEDGTTEHSKGQLSGGINRGLTYGQCHTAGMRDPAQYLDSSRNSTMSANAAR